MDGKRPTKQEIDIYSLISPDFAGLSYKEAAKSLNISLDTVKRAVRRLKALAPQLFISKPNKTGKTLHYEPWMDEFVKKRF